MTERQMGGGRRDQGRWANQGGGDAGGPNARPEPRRDPGAYIGRMPERTTQTIPGGVGPKDRRVAAVATQPEPVRGAGPGSEAGTPPEGHREGPPATDDAVREAGLNR